MTYQNTPVSSATNVGKERAEVQPTVEVRPTCRPTLSGQAPDKIDPAILGMTLTVESNRTDAKTQRERRFSRRPRDLEHGRMLLLENRLCYLTYTSDLIRKYRTPHCEYASMRPNLDASLVGVTSDLRRKQLIARNAQCRFSLWLTVTL